MSSIRLHQHRPAAALVSVAALAGGVLAATQPAVARPAAAVRPAAARMSVVAHGLDNPRLLTVTRHGVVYVAEAGRGGTGPCVTTDEGRKCVGLTGAITRVRHGHARRVVRHLPSLAPSSGQEALGPADVLVRHGHVVATIGAGIDLHQRRSLGAHAGLLGTIVRTTLAHPGHRGVLADIIRFEWQHNPDNSKAHDSDPTGIAPAHHALLLTDSGGNDLLRIARSGRVRTVAVFPDRTLPMPPPPMGPGGTGPMQAVPTAVARGPHGWFVSQLTGFPFPAGGANIYRVVPGHRPRVWASGLTNVTDLAWHDGRLYAVEIASDGLLATPPGSLPMGALVRVHKGDNSSPHVVAGNLPAPYGVALRAASAYVSTCSVCPGTGEVVRVPVG